MWAELPARGSAACDWKACNNAKTHYYEVESLDVGNIFWKKQIMVVCVQYAFHMNQISEQNRQHYFVILKQWMSLKTNVMQKKIRGSWASLKDVLHPSTYCDFFLQEYCVLLKGIPCLQRNYFGEINLSLQNIIWNKWGEGWTSLKDSIFPHIVVFLQEYCLLFKGTFIYFVCHIYIYT